MNPKVFLSYAWESPKHEQWVKELATRLRSDAIELILDKWHTVPGDQLTTFMEEAIRDNDYILIICTPQYKKRFDNREGGVGYEGDIMTAEVMTAQNQRKFIPILKDGDWNISSPTWLKGKYYIDLTGEPYSDENYQSLVKTLYKKRDEAPPLGKKPSYISKIRTSYSSERKLIEKVKEDIIDCFRQSKADAGHTLPAKSFYHKYLMRYNPKEKEAFDDARDELSAEGIIEIKEGHIYLTKTGLDIIY